MTAARSNKEAARECLLTSAIKLFSRRGYDGVTVKEISEDAKVNVAMISYYFGSKEALRDSVFERLVMSKFSTLDQTLSSGRNKREIRIRLMWFLRRIVHFYLENPDLFKLYLEELENENAGAEQFYHTVVSRVFSRFHNFISTGVRAGHIRATEDVYSLSLRIISPIFHLIHFSKTSKRFHGVNLYDAKFRSKLLRETVDAVLV